MELPHWPNDCGTRPRVELERERQERLISWLGGTVAWVFVGVIFFLVIVGISTVVLLVARGLRGLF